MLESYDNRTGEEKTLPQRAACPQEAERADASFFSYAVEYSRRLPDASRKVFSSVFARNSFPFGVSRNGGPTMATHKHAYVIEQRKGQRTHSILYNSLIVNKNVDPWPVWTPPISARHTALRRHPREEMLERSQTPADG